MSSNEIAFFIGLFSSLHCLGMCGPLALALPAIKGRGRLLLLLDKLNYNLGRVVTYSTLGLVTGFIGRELWIAGFQQWVSIVSGLLVVFAAGARLMRLKKVIASPPAFLFLNKALTYAFKHKWGHLIIGMLNGFLPCGFVYMALAGALNTGTISASVSYMFWFGIGTLPLMLLATVGSSLLSMPLRSRISNAAPYFMLLLGAWFILRGVHLDIPYISPAPANSAICR